MIPRRTCGPRAESDLAPDIAIGTANTEVDFAYWHGPAGRAEEPAPHEVRFGEGVEYQLPWRMEVARDLDFAVGGGGDVKAFGIEHGGSI